MKSIHTANMQHVIETQQFDRPMLEGFFKDVDKLVKRYPKDALKGKVMATLFYQPSTRTRFSFESAMVKLGGSVIGTENAAEFSSASKGETLEDSIRIVNGYADVIVLRHPETGSAALAAAVSNVPVINAGDGVGQHPTQALLDLYTIYTETGGIDGKTVVFVGDLKHYRTARSLAFVLRLFKNIKMIFVSPEELKMGDDIKESLTKNGVTFSETTSLEAAVREADVLYVGRIPKEYFEDLGEYEKFKGHFTLTRELVDTMKQDAIIMHPLPRETEIPVEVDSSPHARYFEQAKYGVFVRMALLLKVLH